jgi:hypothetical protein
MEEYRAFAIGHDLPIRPRCPKCKNRMVTVDVAAGPEGFERRNFECGRCGCMETKMIACDPMKSDAVGWMSGELGVVATDDCR